MIGRVYINEISPRAVALDFSSWTKGVLGKGRPYGFAYLKSIEMLEMAHEILPSRRTMLLAGETRQVKEKLPALHRHIGLIARHSASMEQTPVLGEYTRRHIGCTLGWLTEVALPNLADDTPLSELSAALTAPFADAVNDPNELFYVIRDEKPWWFEDHRADTGSGTEWEARSSHIQSFIE